MYVELAIFALLIFLYSIFAKRIEKSIISGPIAFVLMGIVMGPLLLGWFDGDVTRTELRVVADLTLALILFIDAAHADLSILSLRIKIPTRMLLFGLPGVIALGFCLAALIFPELSLFEAAILATMLAATDAALGKAVITNKSVPIHVREGLNAESGLNDGLCVPILLVFIALAEGSSEGSGTGLAIRLVIQELGIGLAVGLGFTMVAGKLMKYCWHQGFVTKYWLHIAVVALALAEFALAQSLHGSGYIAAFTGGLLFGYLAKEETHDLVQTAEEDAETLAMMTWLIFGASVIGTQIDLFTWEIIVYSLFSLTLIRIIPIYLSLTGTGESVSNKLFMGWFGPRGLASIIFAIIVLNSDVEGGNLLASIVVCTVFFSLIAHGLTANPLSKWLAAKEAERGN